MKHREGWLEFRHTKARGTSRLYRQSWLPDSETRAAILLVHGLGEHSGRYNNLAAQCTACGYAVHTLDHYGHGKSDGMPGHVERFSVFVDGVRALRDDVRATEPDLPLFLLGHSMGGLLAATFLDEDQASFQGCVLSGPALRSEAEPPALVMALVRAIAWLAPTAPLLGLDPSGVSRDPDVVAAYVRDPLVHHGKLSARLIAEFTTASRKALADAPGIRLPLLVMHGEDDKLTMPAGSRELYEKAGSTDKTLRLWPGLYHEIFNEPEKLEVIGEMLDWMDVIVPA